MKVCLRCHQEFDGPDLVACPTDGEVLRPALREYAADPGALAGHVLDGRYLVEGLLGEGGMGLVVRARHLFLGRAVAIKLLHPELLLVRETRARFLREASTAAAVRHPGVVEPTDFGVTRDGLHYLVMEHLEGQDLLAWMEATGPLSATAAARVGAQVARALGAVHRAGFVHRDLKPENVWVLPAPTGADPAIKVLDFGIAGAIAGPDGAAEGQQDRLTRTGRTIGTPHYMAPEQARGGAVDGRADLYALGCLLFELVTGEVAFGGASPLDILTAQVTRPPRAPSEVAPSCPAWFDAIVLRCLQKSPALRFPDADALADALEAAAASALAAPEPARPASRGPTDPPVPAATQEHAATAQALPHARSTVSTPRGRVVALAAAIVAVGAAVGVAVWPKSPPSGPPLEAPSAVAERDPRPTTPAPEAVQPELVRAEPRPSLPPPQTADAPEATPVLHRFDVRPRGAEIVLDGQVLGTAPFQRALTAGEGEVAYTLRYVGHREQVVRLSAARSETAEVTLALEDAKPEPPSAPARVAPAPAPRPRAVRAAPAAAATPAPKDPTGLLMRPALPEGEGGP